MKDKRLITFFCEFHSQYYFRLLSFILNPFILMSLAIFKQRNQSIKAEFIQLLRSQMPTMLIYAKIAAEYGLSEDRVRKIIRSP